MHPIRTGAIYSSQASVLLRPPGQMELCHRGDWATRNAEKRDGCCPVLWTARQDRHDNEDNRKIKTSAGGREADSY